MVQDFITWLRTSWSEDDGPSAVLPGTNGRSPVWCRELGAAAVLRLPPAPASERQRHACPRSGTPGSKPRPGDQDPMGFWRSGAAFGAAYQRSRSGYGGALVAQAGQLFGSPTAGLELCWEPDVRWLIASGSFEPGETRDAAARSRLLAPTRPGSACACGNYDATPCQARNGAHRGGI